MRQGQEGYTVGAAAKAAGVTARAVRLYESNGLVRAAGRTPSGYRMFGRDDVDVLVFIRQARNLGLSLDAIAEVLDAATRGAPCERTKELLAQRLDEIDQAIADLQGLRAAILRAQQIDTSGVRCGVIESLG